MGHQDLKQRFKNLQGKIGLLKPKDRDDTSDSHSVESQKHQPSNAPVIKDNGSDTTLSPSNESSKKQENVVLASHLLKPSQISASPRSDDVPIKELWNIAYEKLRAEDGELIKEYERKLEGNMVASLGSMLESNTSMRDRMQTILEYKMDEVNADTWKLKFRSSEVEVKDVVQPILGIVSLVNDYITGAVSANPYASLAWAGISLLLPLFMNPLAQATSLAKGLAFISTLIAQSRMREELYVRRYESKTRDDQSFQQSHREYKNGLERLYRQVLKFQATTYCYFTNDSASRLLSDMIKQNNWDQLIDGVREQEAMFAKLATTWSDIQYDNECSAAENRHKEMMNLWFTIGANVSSLERAVKDAQEQKDRIELLQWLCDIDHTELYNSARRKHTDGTGEWLIDRSDEFRTWEERIVSKSFLWLHGKAGSGKSILSSSVIRHLQDRHKGNALNVLAYFYFSFSDIQKQKVDGMLSSLIRQISAHRPYIPRSVQSLGEYKNKGGRPDTDTLIEALIASMQGFSAVYIILDALDECPMLDGERKKLLNSLRHILKKAPDSLHILCTSRKEVDIDKAMKPLLFESWGTEVDLSIRRQVLDHDISQYIDSILADSEYDTWPKDIKAESRNALMEKADCMFQYVRCQFDNLQKLSSVDAVRKALRDLPSGLDSTYDRMLQSIDASFQPQVIASLKWLAFSISPLEVEQLAEIFALPLTFNDGFESMSHLFSSMDVLRYFPGLLVTEEGETWNRDGTRRKTLHVRLAHFSIKEYLTSDRIFYGHSSVFAFTEADAHMHIASFSLAYHLHISSTTNVPDLDEYSSDYKFQLVKYAAQNWAEHLEMIPHASWAPEVSRNAILALSIRSQSLLIITSNYGESEDFIRRPHCYTTFRGFHQLTKMLISGYIGVNKYLTQADFDEGLRYATIYGRRNIARLFLERGAQIRNCLEQAASQVDVAIVELLLDHGARINALTGKLDPALRAALWNGHLDGIKLLLSRGADVNSPFNKAEYMPKSIHLDSRESNCVACLNFLFYNGAGLDLKDSDSLTVALGVALRLGFKDASNLLLDRGANVNELVGLAGYPLQVAMIRLEFEPQFIRSLLGRGADPNARGGTYGTALQAACDNVYRFNVETMTQVIELLLSSGADVSIQGGIYGTALQAACRNDGVPVAIIELLLQKGADVNVQGGRYGNALQAACRRADKESALEVVTLLLKHDAFVDTKGGYYETALQAACAKEYQDIVRLLLHRGADVNAQGGRYGTALQVACATGNLEVVRLLLEQGAEVNVEAGYHGTALQAACAKGHIQVARLLLEHGADVHLRNDGAWHAAARARSDDLLSLLLDHGVDVNDPRGLYGSALHALFQRVWNTNKPGWEEDNDGLDLEIEHGDFDWESRIRFLLERGADPHLAVGEHGTPLQMACSISFRLSHMDRNMYPAAAGLKFLLEICPNLNVNAQGGLFGSALQAAAYSGQTPSISLLLSKGAHVNAGGGRYGSALNAAVIAGNWDIVEILLKAGATPDCHMLSEPDEEWLRRVLEDDGEGGVERYRRFWEVEKGECT